MEYIIVFVIGFALGWYLQSWISARAFIEILKDLDVPDDKIVELAQRDGADTSEFETEVTDKIVIELKVEQVGERLLAYRAEDDLFVTQGDNAQELISELVKKYPVGYNIEINKGSELVEDEINRLKKAL